VSSDKVRKRDQRSKREGRGRAAARGSPKSRDLSEIRRGKGRIDEILKEIESKDTRET
jgi:hypothetical protein